MLHIINDLATGGAEKLVTDTVPLYNSKGIETDILLLNGRETPFMRQLKEAGYNVYDLGQGSTYNPLLAFKIMPYLKKYDIVHVHLFPAQYWVALAKRLSFSKVKLVYTEHNTSSRRMRKTVFRIIDPIVYKSYKKIICIANDVLTSLKNHINIPENKIELIHNGVDVKKIRDAASLTKQCFYKDNDVQLLLQVSSFQGAKDQPTLIKALKFLPDNIRLLLAGDGSRKEECIALVNKLDLAHRVLFLGIRMDVPQLLKTADIIVLSSKYEGLSLSSIEGMAAGRPFIASDVPGLSNIVGGAGILFPYADEKQLAMEIKKLFNDSRYYTQVSEKCSMRASEYDITIMVDRHIEAYKALLNQ